MIYLKEWYYCDDYVVLRYVGNNFYYVDRELFEKHKDVILNSSFNAADLVCGLIPLRDV